MLRLRTAASSSAARSATFLPSSAYCPALGRSRQPITFMKVDLPEPEGPITATNSPLSMSTLTPSSARTSPPPMWYVFTRLRVWMSIRRSARAAGRRSHRRGRRAQHRQCR